MFLFTKTIKFLEKVDQELEFAQFSWAWAVALQLAARVREAAQALRPAGVHARHYGRAHGACAHTLQ